MLRRSLVYLVVWAAVAGAQTSETLESLGRQLERLERQNAELAEQVRLLRAEMETLKRPAAPEPTADGRLAAVEEQVALQAGRLAEQEQVKVESSQKSPVRLTGMALFNAFRNGHHGGTLDYPLNARVPSDRINSGAKVANSVIGLEFEAPNAVMGGRFRGSFLLDLSAGDGTPTGTLVRLRTASIEGQWKTRGFLVGQEKPIFSPREPNSLAELVVAPLAGAGNLWIWRPQVRFEQRIKLGPAQELRAHIGVSQTREGLGIIPAQFLPTLESRRPALEGNFRFSHRFDDFRRVEIAPGFHWSSTHVAGVSLPSSIFSLDWFWNPVRQLEFTGAMFSGSNLTKFGGLGSTHGFVISTPRPGEIRAIAVRGRGGWAQLTWIATPRLSFNVFSGQHDLNNRDLPSTQVVDRNLSYGVNFFYRLAPNVLTGIEASQTRTWWMTGQRPLNNHYDLYVAYLF